MTFDEFSIRAGRANVIPMTRTLLADMVTPVSAYLALRPVSRYSFLFESVEANERIGRYSFLGADPLFVIRSHGDSYDIVTHGGTRRETGTVFDALRTLQSRYTMDDEDLGAGFTGGFVGYLGYDAVRHLEHLPAIVPPGDSIGEAMFGLFESVIRFDHTLQTITVIHNIIVETGLPLWEQFEKGRSRLDALELRLRRPGLPPGAFAAGEPEADSPSRQGYEAAVERAKAYIVEGDIFQVVLSRRITMTYTGDLFCVYRALRMINPSPYLFYVEFDDTTLVGSSPEILLRVEDGEVRVLPIAGTRKRGQTEEEDRALEAELLADEKELAEHIMLVDLGRNDVGRIAEYGSVQVPVLKTVERYSHVMHLVSVVTGRMRGSCSSVDALAACFPAGTVSGAPKVRAMQIIAELEPFTRGAYAGAVGYLGFNGSLDTCIAIRTLFAHHGVLTVQVGAGIVADSIPAKEYEETVNKSGAMMDALRCATRGLKDIPFPRFSE